ncbi:30S ribosomal protein S4 [Candidatus Hepatobacter penaei]|uniref:30S ribosomal protein S4 n=1 Tax=Candidatus Hepatobacter penaei TaxID=1274402 RepID=UPI0004F2D54C|nr:30S ribosomal protein S4 [Candidatus Hepatobacter penaei]TGW15216.1 30S ribosomal protein S4 [bacterium NHP-B]
MSKRLASKYKIDRRYGVNLWGREKSPVNLRDYKPGQHGVKARAGGGGGGGKASPYGLQLAAKQKLRGYYGGIRESQFRRFYKEAVRLTGDTGENFIGLLERRLDAVVYRMKFVPTIFAARQFVNHGHVTVNGKPVNIPSYLVCAGDEIEVKTASKSLTIVLEAAVSPERDVPAYLEVDNKKMKGVFVRIPALADVPYPAQMEPHLITEWYARRV